ncbi:hypothetical protein L204_101497 [Cryptococcus depauperatus]|nr:hypothetical protein L204_04171 [Cryptococcus depauperatus CBS 7855]
MALGSSSASVLRNGMRPNVKRLAQQTRTFAAPAVAEYPSPSFPPQSLHSQSASHMDTYTSVTTPTTAQKYLSDLLSLPSQRQFPPPLALQILTHKSYRYSHPARHAASPEETLRESSAPHNARLAFLGRRALSTYLAIFMHEIYGSTERLRNEGSDFLRGKELETRLKALTHVNNLGRMVGGDWGVEKVLRWDENPTSRLIGNLSVKGQAVEAILGGVFTQFGSPAAHRTFHLHVLPKFTSQLRDPLLVEKVESARLQLEQEFGRSMLPKQ